jgi:hypothetical protein
MEMWKDIEFGNGRYSVSNAGKVKNNLTGNLIKPQIQNSGYYLVHLHSEGKRKAITIHRLVAIAFIDNPEDKSMVDHIDCNKLNNCVHNLRWVTPCENGRYAVENGLFKNAAEKAKVRMSVIGKQYAKQNTANLLAEVEKRKKPILQLTMSGDFIKEWPSIKQAESETKCYNLRKVVRGEYAQSGGFKWSLKQQFPSPHISKLVNI